MRRTKNRVTKYWPILVVLALGGWYLWSHHAPATIPSRGIDLNDDDLKCEAGYRVCFTPPNLIHKTFPQPFQLSDLANNSRSSIPIALGIIPRDSHFLHYPGNLYRLEDKTNAAPGGGRALNVLDIGGLGSRDIAKADAIFKFDSYTVTKSEWRPDRMSYVLSSGVQWSIMGISSSIYLGNISFRGTTVTATGPKILDFSGTLMGPTWGTYNGYVGWRRTTPTHNLYVLFSNPIGISGNDAGVTITSPYDGYIAFVMESALSQVPNLFAQPNEWIVNATAFYQNWYRQRAPPTLETTNWGKERYYLALNTHLNLFYQSYPLATTKLWGNYWAPSPGSQYAGVWIWDSFFQAWSAIDTCTVRDCLEPYMDGLRILSANQYGDGHFPRQVEHYTKKGTIEWQAPGGWSLAVDQADKKFGGDTYSREFYGNLTAFHNFVMTKDSDGNGVFEWSYTDSGWDNGPRWVLGNMNAVDLQSWMIMDAESLRNIATRLGKPSNEIQQWEDRRNAYISDLRTHLCSPGPYCYDTEAGTGQVSTVLTPATYFPLLVGALTPAQVQAMFPALHNYSLLGPGPGEVGILPSLSRSDPGYDPDSGTYSWGGPYWTNLALITYLGLLRYGFIDEANYVRTHMQTLLQQGGLDVESYVSDGANVGHLPNAGFYGPVYGWTSSNELTFAHGTTFTDFGTPSGCTDGQTRPCTSGLDSGTQTCANNLWGDCIVCSTGTNRDCGANGRQSCISPGQWEAGCTECSSTYTYSAWGTCTAGTATRTVLSDLNNCRSYYPAPDLTTSCECTNGDTASCTPTEGGTGTKTCQGLFWSICIADTQTCTVPGARRYCTGPGVQTCTAGAWTTCSMACVGTDVPLACSATGISTCQYGQWMPCESSIACSPNGYAQACYTQEGILGSQTCNAHWDSCTVISCTPNTVHACYDVSGHPGLQTCTSTGTSYTECCASQWGCDGFGACVNGIQHQSCTDLNNCNPQSSPPPDSRTCTCDEGTTRNCGITIDSTKYDGQTTCTDGQWGTCLQCDPIWSATYSSCVGNQWLVTRTDENLCANTTTTTEPCSPTCQTDRDGDTYKAEAACTQSGLLIDCNDNNDAIKPTAPEGCDGVDNNCVGGIDEGVTRTCFNGTTQGTQPCIAPYTWGSCSITSYATASCDHSTCTLDINGEYATIASCEAVCHCLPTWSCGQWSAYSNGTCGYRTQSCTDTHVCPDVVSPKIQSDRLPCPGATCGNNEIEDGERCDGTSLNDQTCQSVDPQTTGGLLSCTNCTSYNTSACTYAAPKLTYYACNLKNQCVQDTTGQYRSSTCSGQCVHVSVVPYVSWLGGAVVIGLILWLILRPRRRR